MTGHIYGILVVAFICYLYMESRRFRVTHYEIESEKLSGLQGEIKIVVLADLHNHVYGKDNSPLIEAVKAQKPDLILAAGDLLVAKPGRTIDVALSLLERLTPVCPVYYANGNHEYRLKLYPHVYGDMYERYFEGLNRLHIPVLDNRMERISVKNTVLNIWGAEIDKEYYRRFTKQELPKGYMETLLGKAGQEEYTLLLAHNPKYFPSYAEWGADLTLSGHLHGGLVNIPGLGGVASPHVEFFPKYDAGLFEEKGRHMILSRGLGTHTINVRVHNRAEIVCVTLKNSCNHRDL